MWIQKFQQNSVFVKNDKFSLQKHPRFMPYLGQYLSYRDVPYLILILSTIWFDLYKIKFALQLIFFQL